ncbi:MAG: type IV pili methyl-accepting chemotaxis transducer N-terminal domain-containing protein [Nibricoccus sp.]
METLDKKLQAVIERLSDSARTSKIISMNAAFLADRGADGREETSAAIKVVASEIQRLSTASSNGILELNGILSEVRLLTQTINLAGRQRMISQKVMKLFLIEATGADPKAGAERHKWAGEFETALEKLRKSRLNTVEISMQLERVMELWAVFARALQNNEIMRAVDLNERVLSEMHATVLKYEALAGGTAAVA